MDSGHTSSDRVLLRVLYAILPLSSSWRDYNYNSSEIQQNFFNLFFMLSCRHSYSFGSDDSFPIDDDRPWLAAAFAILSSFLESPCTVE